MCLTVAPQSARIRNRLTGKAALVHKRFELSLGGAFKACMRRDATLMWRNRVRPRGVQTLLLLPLLVAEAPLAMHAPLPAAGRLQHLTASSAGPGRVAGSGRQQP